MTFMDEAHQRLPFREQFFHSHTAVSMWYVFVNIHVNRLFK